MEPPGTDSVFNKNQRSTAIPVAKFPAGKPPVAHIPPAHQPPAKHPANTPPPPRPPLPAGEPLATHIPPAHQPPLRAGKPAAGHIPSVHQSPAAQIPPAHQPPVKHPPAKPKSHYIPGLDGLRALAVVSVIIYHLHPSGFPGGFLGVDIFFVLSGFLITTLLLRELSKTGKVSLSHFWLRRARRLLPALLVLIITVVPTAFLVNRDLLVGIGRQVLGALTFSTNWLEIAHGSSYFAAMLLLTDASPYTFREGIAGCSLVVALLIWCILKPGSLLARLGELRLLKYIGTRSYGLYLWHWPILIIAGALYPTAVESALYWVRSVLCVLITVLICELSYRLLETPVRKRGFRKAFSRPQAPIWQRLIQVVVVLLALALTGVTGLAIAQAPSKSQTQLAIEQAQKQHKEETKKTPTPKPTTPEPEPTPVDDRLVLSENLDTSNPSGEEITAIGDSIITAASGGFDKAMPGINFLAKPNRQWGIASEIISEGLAAGEIRRTVVISFGTNAGVYDANLVHQAIKQLGPDRMILLVNLYSPSTFVPESNRILADIANQYANVKLVDWHQAVSQHPEWLHVDQTHPNMTGAVKMGELVRTNIDEMSAELTALKAKQKKQRERASAPHSRKKR